MHAGHAVQEVNSPAKAHERRKEARGGSSISDEEFQRLIFCACSWNFPAQALHGDGSITKIGWIRGNADGEPELLETLHHRLGVLAPERALQSRFAVSQGRENQRAV